MTLTEQAQLQQKASIELIINGANNTILLDAVHNMSYGVIDKPKKSYKWLLENDLITSSGFPKTTYLSQLLNDEMVYRHNEDLLEIN